MQHFRSAIFLCFVNQWDFFVQAILTDLQHLPRPRKLKFTWQTNTMAPWPLPTARTSTSATWTSLSSAPMSSAPWTGLTCASLTSTSLPAAWALPLHLSQAAAAPLDPSPFPAPTFSPTASRLGRRKAGLPPGRERPLRAGNRVFMKTSAPNLRWRRSSWARAITAVPAPPHRRIPHRSTPPSVPPPTPHRSPPRPPLSSLSTLTFRAPGSTAPYPATLPTCTSIRTFIRLAGRTRRRSSTAWLWRRLHAAPPWAGSSPSTPHSAGLEVQMCVHMNRLNSWRATEQWQFEAYRLLRGQTQKCPNKNGQRMDVCLP